MTDLQKAVRGYLSVSDIEKLKIRKEFGYVEETNPNLSLHEHDILFTRWLKGNNKVKEFVDRCLGLYNF